MSKNMHKTSIKKNIIYQMLYEIMVLLLPLATSPYISRVLGPEKLGVYSYTYSIASYFGMVAMLGVRNYGNREIAKNRDNPNVLREKFCSIYAVQLFASLTVICMYILYAIIFAGEYKLYAWIQVLYVISCMLDINWFFCGMEQFKLTVTRSTIVKITTFCLIFVLVRTADDLWKYCLIMSGCLMISQLIMWGNLRNYTSLTKVSSKMVIAHVKPMLILFIPVVAISLYNIMDKIMLGSISTKEQLGFYENSEKIIFCVKTVITAFGTVMLPHMSKLASDGKHKESERYMSLSIEFVMFVAFALSFGIASVAGQFSVIFWGNSFQACGPLLIGLCISIPFSAFANVIRTQFLIPHGMDQGYVISTVSGAVVNLIANFIFIYRCQAIGAVIGTICAESIVCLIQCIYVARKGVPVHKFMKKGIPFLGIGVVMCLVVLFTDRFWGETLGGLLLRIIVGASVYLLLALAYFILTKNELLYSFLKKLREKSYENKTHSQ